MKNKRRKTKIGYLFKWSTKITFLVSIFMSNGRLYFYEFRKLYFPNDPSFSLLTSKKTCAYVRVRAVRIHC